MGDIYIYIIHIHVNKYQCTYVYIYIYMYTYSYVHIMLSVYKQSILVIQAPLAFYNSLARLGKPLGLDVLADAATAQRQSHLEAPGGYHERA